MDQYQIQTDHTAIFGGLWCYVVPKVKCHALKIQNVKITTRKFNSIIVNISNPLLTE